MSQAVISSDATAAMPTKDPKPHAFRRGRTGGEANEENTPLSEDVLHNVLVPRKTSPEMTTLSCRMLLDARRGYRENGMGGGGKRSGQGRGPEVLVLLAKDL